VKDKPSAAFLLLVSVAIWCIPLLALIVAATGDCMASDCPTEAERAWPVVIAMLVALVLQIAAAFWYARAHYRE